MDDVVGGIREWATSSVFLRALFLGLLILLLQIPILYIGALTSEREQTRAFAVSEVTNIWGGAQTLSGPVLVIPYRYQGTHEQGWAMTETRYAHFLPDQLDIRAVMTTEVRRRGIFEVPLYRANLEITGAFSRPNFSDWEIEPDDVLWNRATLSVGISEPRGIQERVVLELNGQEIAFKPGKGETSYHCAGIHAPITEIHPATSSEGTCRNQVS